MLDQPALRYPLAASACLHLALLLAIGTIWPIPVPTRAALRIDVRLKPPPEELLPPTSPLERSQDQLRQTAQRANREPSPAAVIVIDNQPIDKDRLTITPRETSIDLEAIRQSIRRPIASRPETASPEHINLAPKAREPEPPALNQAVARSINASCKEKYAGAGLLAIPLLLKDSFSNDCVW
jgi:hypothetical protein